MKMRGAEAFCALSLLSAYFTAEGIYQAQMFGALIFAGCAIVFGIIAKSMFNKIKIQNNGNKRH